MIKNQIDIMIDLETLSLNTKNPMILSIGACLFHPYDYSMDIIDTFYVEIDIQYYKDKICDINTLLFWLKESNLQTFLKIIRSDKLHSPTNAFKEFKLWIDSYQHRYTNIWSKDPNFDLEILDNLDEYPLFDFRQKRSVRSILDLGKNLKIEQKDTLETPHHALYDAVYQARCISNILTTIGDKFMNTDTIIPTSIHDSYKRSKEVSFSTGSSSHIKEVQKNLNQIKVLSDLLITFTTDALNLGKISGSNLTKINKNISALVELKDTADSALLDIQTQLDKG